MCVCVCVCVCVWWAPHLCRKRPSSRFTKSCFGIVGDSSGQVYPCKPYCMCDKLISSLFFWHCFRAPSYNFKNLLPIRVLCQRIVGCCWMTFQKWALKSFLTWDSIWYSLSLWVFLSYSLTFDIPLSSFYISVCLSKIRSLSLNIYIYIYIHACICVFVHGYM